jgi:hypothetical protein
LLKKIEPHPIFADAIVPQFVELGDFRLTMLTAADLDGDMAAIEESAAELDGIFGNSWPRGLTRETDLADLERHHREFIERIAYAWVIRNAAGAYIGWAYLKPTADRYCTARAIHWMRTSAVALGPAFAAQYHAWLRGPDWPALELLTESRP